MQVWLPELSDDGDMVLRTKVRPFTFVHVQAAISGLLIPLLALLSSMGIQALGSGFPCTARLCCSGCRVCPSVWLESGTCLLSSGVCHAAIALARTRQSQSCSAPLEECLQRKRYRPCKHALLHPCRGHLDWLSIVCSAPVRRSKAQYELLTLSTKQSNNKTSETEVLAEASTSAPSLVSLIVL